MSTNTKPLAAVLEGGQRGGGNAIRAQDEAAVGGCRSTGFGAQLGSGEAVDLVDPEVDESLGLVT